MRNRKSTFCSFSTFKVKCYVISIQVHLEVDPKPTANMAHGPNLRLDLLSDLLTKYLGLECDSSERTIKYTPSYFLGRHEVFIFTVQSLFIIQFDIL